MYKFDPTITFHR
uniref:Uncharacterized protein n=1 Tax=Arundo donax TaxID=35708 RepID=A0A0A8Y0M5_ARUDO